MDQQFEMWLDFMSARPCASASVSFWSANRIANAIGLRSALIVASKKPSVPLGHDQGGSGESRRIGKQAAETRAVTV